MLSRKTLASVLALAAIAFAAGCGDDDGGDEERTTLTFDSPTIEIKVVDEQPADASKGDVRAFTSPLIDESGAEVGRLDGTVVVTDLVEQGGEQVEFRAGTIQFTLDGGNIVASGVYVAPIGEVAPAETGVERAIVGGTGEYEGASGVVTQTRLDGQEYRSVLEFETEGD